MKEHHIVYKTTCIKTQHYYLGVHSTNNINDGYIGSGIKFRNYVKKYGKKNFIREILHECLSRDEAFEYERQILTTEILNDDKCLNLVGGGRGIKHKYDETFRDRISKTRKLKIKQGKIIPTKHTKEHKQRLHQHNPGGKATAKAICQIDTSGEVIKEWPSSRSAGITLKLKSWRNFSALANKKTPQTAYGFYWRWKDDPDIINQKLINIDNLERIRIDKSSRAGRKIIQLDLSGRPNKKWKNMCEAARALHIDNSAISVAIKTGRQYANSFWVKDDFD